MPIIRVNKVRWQHTMFECMRKVILALMLMPGLLWLPTSAAWGVESVGQERLAYLELSRIRTLSTSNVTYNNYRDALNTAREYVWLLQGTEKNVVLLRQVMSRYEQALAVWKLQTDSEFPVDSLRSDEPDGADILRQCPAIARFHYKERDQIYVKDAVDCIWHQAAELLESAPAELR